MITCGKQPGQTNHHEERNRFQHRLTVAFDFNLQAAEAALTPRFVPGLMPTKEQIRKLRGSQTVPAGRRQAPAVHPTLTPTRSKCVVRVSR